MCRIPRKLARISELGHGGLQCIFGVAVDMSIRRTLTARLKRNDVGFWQIVLKKSLSANDGKFSGPVVRLSRCKVRDHINYAKSIARDRIDSTEPCSG